MTAGGRGRPTPLRTLAASRVGGGRTRGQRGPHAPRPSTRWRPVRVHAGGRALRSSLAPATQASCQPGLITQPPGLIPGPARFSACSQARRCGSLSAPGDSVELGFGAGRLGGGTVQALPPGPTPWEAWLAQPPRTRLGSPWQGRPGGHGPFPGLAVLSHKYFARSRLLRNSTRETPDGSADRRLPGRRRLSPALRPAPTPPANTGPRCQRPWTVSEETPHLCGGPCVQTSRGS